MADIDISGLKNNTVTKPFFVAAALDSFGDPQKLSKNEALLYALYQEQPDTEIDNKMSEAQQFLKSLAPDQAQAIRRRAQDMYGIASLLTAGAVEKMPKRDWKMFDFQIPAEQYRTAYFSNPSLSFEALKRKLAVGQRDSVLKEYQAETARAIHQAVGKKEQQSGHVIVIAVGILTLGAIVLMGRIMPFSLTSVNGVTIGLHEVPNEA